VLDVLRELSRGHHGELLGRVARETLDFAPPISLPFLAERATDLHYRRSLDLREEPQSLACSLKNIATHALGYVEKLNVTDDDAEQEATTAPVATTATVEPTSEAIAAALGAIPEDKLHGLGMVLMDRMGPERRASFLEVANPAHWIVDSRGRGEQPDEATSPPPAPTSDADGKRLWMIAVQQTPEGCTAQVMHQQSPICCAASTPKEAIARVADTFWMLKGGKS